MVESSSPAGAAGCWLGWRRSTARRQERRTQSVAAQRLRAVQRRRVDDTALQAAAAGRPGSACPSQVAAACLPLTMAHWVSAAPTAAREARGAPCCTAPAASRAPNTAACSLPWPTRVLRASRLGSPLALQVASSRLWLPQHLWQQYRRTRQHSPQTRATAAATQVPCRHLPTPPASSAGLLALISLSCGSCCSSRTLMTGATSLCCTTGPATVAAAAAPTGPRTRPPACAPRGC